MEFHASHASDRGRFEILAFHDASAKSFEDLDPKLADLKKEAWNGQDLPFPILLDATGKTVAEFGIRMFPTTLLVDPEGNLVKGGREPMLAKRLSECRPAVVERAKKLAAAPGGKKETLSLLGEFGPADGEDGLCVLGLYLQVCEEPECADAALEAMGRIGGEPMTSMMWLREQGLMSPDARRQERAAAILGRTLPVGYLQSLFESAERPSTSAGAVRAICEALAARAGEDPDIPGVLRAAAASTTNPVLAAAAKAALEKIR